MIQRWGEYLMNAAEQILFHVGLLILRAGFGLMMLLGHGWEKLVEFNQLRHNFPDPIGLGSTVSLALCVFAEVVCSALVTLGLLTRLALVPLIVNMLVAAVVIHGQDPWAKRELACVYLTVYLSLILAGPGRFSVDALFGRRAPVQA